MEGRRAIQASRMSCTCNSLPRPSQTSNVSARAAGAHWRRALKSGFPEAISRRRYITSHQDSLVGAGGCSGLERCLQCNMRPHVRVAARRRDLPHASGSPVKSARGQVTRSEHGRLRRGVICCGETGGFRTGAVVVGGASTARGGVSGHQPSWPCEGRDCKGQDPCQPEGRLQ